MEVGKQKIHERQLDSKIDMVLGDSEKMPFVDDSFDAITVAFGIRNFENFDQNNNTKQSLQVST